MLRLIVSLLLISLMLSFSARADGVAQGISCPEICESYPAIVAVYVGPIKWETDSLDSDGLFYRLIVLEYEEYRKVAVEHIHTGPEGVVRQLESQYEFDTNSFPQPVSLSSLTTSDEAKITWMTYDVVQIDLDGVCFNLRLATEPQKLEISRCKM